MMHILELEGMMALRKYKAKDGSHIIICPFKKFDRVGYVGFIRTTFLDGQQKGDEYKFTIDLNDYILNIAGTQYELKLTKIGISEILSFDLMKGLLVHDSFTFAKD